MTLPLPALLDVLWALDEETRLRIVALLQHGELTVTDLTDILGQSQPRISRHLKLLADAGVVDKHREGTWAFFDLVAEGPIGRLVSDVSEMLLGSIAVSGNPVCPWMMPLTCQPPSVSLVIGLRSVSRGSS